MSLGTPEKDPPMPIPTPPRRPLALSALAAALAAAPAGAQATYQLSLDDNQVQASDAAGTGPVHATALTPDGRFAAFVGADNGLVPGDTNGHMDVFVRDRVTATVELVSVATGGAQGDDDSFFPGISSDGRFVVFQSYATNLVAGDTNGYGDIFVHDRQTGVTERVSLGNGGVQANFPSDSPSISGDGSYVEFWSGASNLVGGDTNGVGDIFVRDRILNRTSRVSIAQSGAQANSGSWNGRISESGRFVAFVSDATNLVFDNNGVADVFRHDRTTFTTIRAQAPIGTPEWNGACAWPSLSSNGSWVAFESDATNIVAGDTNGATDVFAYQFATGAVRRVSEDSNGVQANGPSELPMISPDGTNVAYESAATNLVAGDTNGYDDIFLTQIAFGITYRVSLSTKGAQGDFHSFYPAVGLGGDYVLYASQADNLIPDDTNSASDVFLFDRTVATPTTYCTGKVNSLGCLSAIDCEGAPSASGAGAFEITASNIKNGVNGLLFYSVSGAAAFPFQGGWMCMNGPRIRTPIQSSGGSPPPATNCSGAFWLEFNDLAGSDPSLVAGVNVQAQWWSRDPQSPSTTNLTDAVEFELGL